MAGLGLIAYGVYSSNPWFYLGVIPLIIGLTNWCPLERFLGFCPNGSCSVDGGCNTKTDEDKSKDEKKFTSFATKKECCGDDKCC